MKTTDLKNRNNYLMNDNGQMVNVEVTYTGMCGNSYRFFYLENGIEVGFQCNASFVEKCICEMPTLKVRDTKKYTRINYENTGDESKIGMIVFKESVLQDGENPIGVVLQVHDDGDYRADMYGNTNDVECRPATIEEIKQYRPQLLGDIDSFSPASMVNATLFIDETDETIMFSAISVEAAIKNINLYIDEVFDGGNNLDLKITINERFFWWDHVFAHYCFTEGRISVSDFIAISLGEF